jgi:ABC-type amino acid transport substrate-binding protein
MNDGAKVEERIAFWLLEEAPDEPPGRVLDAAFEQTRHMPQRQALGGRAHAGTRLALLAAATLLIIGSLMAYAVMGGRLAPPTEPPPSADALQRLISAGVVRVALRPDNPQSTGPGGGLDGFDVDVATELGRRLGLRVELVPVPPADLFRQPRNWDVGLPSTPAWTVDSEAYFSTSPYYAWPHLLLVPTASGATSVADVQGQPICAVAGDAGQGWLLGRYGGTAQGGASTPPIPSTLILKASDAECLAALASGQVRAVVTATMLPADAASQPGIQAIDGPPPEPRVAVVARGDSVGLLEAVDSALEAMRTDGTLTRMSESRFGADLTSELP